jgi:hypothetical protein
LARGDRIPSAALRHGTAAWSDEHGSFRIVGAAAGHVTVIVVDPGTGDRDSRSLELDPGSPEWLWFHLGPGPS